ncbi:outer membrane protein [Psychroflexus gondwanensis ACAM 44]|uniref:Outer membrane protein n=1 Tax=Psychroflexus gondwanensis ACAM 44 TaxID=1189619 RepID=N1WT78_9FLAO|nr:ShlB/FhaC/HecB family hemolysin secretion/activation protein [Psychroflexus gondwanensis]EMY80412.1 outer membrane protein [Psychroflexus gondwanensis ACAM 44]
MLKLLFTFLCVVGLPFHSHCQTIHLQVDTLKDSLLSSKQFTFDSFNAAETELKLKMDSLKRVGYPFLELDQQITDKKLLATIRLNQKIDSLYIGIKKEDLIYIPKGIKIDDLEIGLPYQNVEIFQKAIIEKLKAQGLSFGKSFLTDLEYRNAHALNAKLVIDSGLKRRIDKINIKGYESLPKSYISYLTGLKIGSEFIESQIQQKTEKLDNIPFISVKKPTEVLFKKDSTELFLYLEKFNSNTFDGFLGFGNNETSDFELNGYLNMVLLNNLNFGERLGVIYKNDGNGQQTFEGNVELPFVFSSPVTIGADLRIFRRDSAFSNSSQTVELKYYLNEKLNLKGAAEFTNSTSLEQENLNSISEIDDYNSSFYGIGAEYLKLGPRQLFGVNTFVNLNLSAGSRKTKNDTEQYKLSLSGQHQININYRNRLYLNLNSQILISDNFLNNELFRFGGVNSIRGFAENSLLASRFAVLQTEYRYILDANLYANTVIDVGNYENRLNNVNENILGYGAGIGLKSQAGIFNLIIANSVSDVQESTFSNTRIHINFTSFF